MKQKYVIFKQEKHERSMQTETIRAHIKEEAQKAQKYFQQLESDSHLTSDEANELLSHIEKIYRNLCVYVHSLNGSELGSDLKVHLKIMQTVASENNVMAEKTIETEKETVSEEPTLVSESAMLRKIELSINNRFRIANELFNQSQVEFNAAFQQLNSINTLEEAMRYMESLKQVYKWKDENPLVKNFYALVQKRFV